MRTTRQQTAYYGNNSHGHPTAMLCTEWKSGARSGRIMERTVSCDSLEQARAIAYGMSRNVKPLAN